MIHSVDRPKIASALGRGDEARGKAPAPARAGEHRRGAAEVRRSAGEADAFISLCRDALSFPSKA